MRGVKEVAIIDQALLGSADARKLDEYAAVAAGGLCRSRARLRRKDEETPIHGPVGLFEAVTGGRPQGHRRCSATKASAR